MRNPDPNFVGHLLTGSVDLHTGLIIPKLITLAQPEVTVLGVVPILEPSGVGAKESLGVAGVVGFVKVRLVLPQAAAVASPGERVGGDWTKPWAVTLESRPRRGSNESCILLVLVG